MAKRYRREYRSYCPVTVWNEQIFPWVNKVTKEKPKAVSLDCMRKMFHVWPVQGNSGRKEEEKKDIMYIAIFIRDGIAPSWLSVWQKRQAQYWHGFESLVRQGIFLHVNFQCRLSYGVRTAPVCNRMRNLKSANAGSHTIVGTQENTAHTDRNG